MGGDLDRWIEDIKQCKLLPELDLKHLCEYVQELMLEESTVQPVQAPWLAGHLVGQFHDLLELFNCGGDRAARLRPRSAYIFMGDFVDRGYNSARWPHRITLLRGNHESRQITQVYGFYDECQRKYGNTNPWRYCTELFDWCPLAAIVDGRVPLKRVLCVHGGLSPEVRTIDQMRLIDRKQEIPHEGAFCDLMWSGPGHVLICPPGAFCDLMWSDPDDIDTWAVSPRGAGWLFGQKVTHEFNAINGLELICRAHQLVQEGYKYMFEESLVTVWSAPNYCYRCGNDACILALDDQLVRNFKIFKEVESTKAAGGGGQLSNVPYFL
ncbi:hypothetical protein EMIHUDRAFT_428593 [Emiliania huxleyi CCMP1516]|uniref:Serine/threonine-protein phosphatase n=2 Tax=Emiliania huxleyi TaxID=2903 RepID=A0A0D3HZX2_EMIH1|nr:hypothetical protein EMIHUDRAFT_428593 [Emiliania huxleyi CCMP1516]EOD04557.1 hypothetical protein EMIHUDRAFT_428593 [Emiliania huxleyi CCMP1516]|eukprot:XP_005756986.1 hypothetical protein EMIHUDRAFT_428593 [Emiliania huxleyi CCMP1516]